MTKIIIEEDISEIIEGEVKGSGSNTFFPVPKKHRGKIAKLLIIDKNAK